VRESERNNVRVNIYLPITKLMISGMMIFIETPASGRRIWAVVLGQV
jgi:hypothetical protein